MTNRLFVLWILSWYKLCEWLEQEQQFFLLAESRIFDIQEHFLISKSLRLTTPGHHLG